jgi:hypothetical protein
MDVISISYNEEQGPSLWCRRGVAMRLCFRADVTTAATECVYLSNKTSRVSAPDKAPLSVHTANSLFDVRSIGTEKLSGTW